MNQEYLNHYLNEGKSSIVAFEKQISRENQKSAFIAKNSVNNGSPNEKRFDNPTQSQTPSILESMTDWRKQSPKKTLLNVMKKQFYNCGDYNPQFEKVSSKLDTGCKS